MLFDDILFFTEGLIPVSIFKNTTVNYQQGCPQLTVLQIRRKHLETEETSITYQRKGYLE